MKLPFNWLKELVDVTESVQQVADRLTMIGLEVESIDGGHDFNRVVVGEVISIEKHPNADKLHLTKVNVGLKDPLQIVCGANNLEVGIKVPVVLIGGHLGELKIKKVSLRGVESHGMICSERELGLGENHEGIMILDKAAKIGSSFADHLGKQKVIDVSVLANRPDCMGMWGLANEVAAATNKRLNLPQIKLNEDKKDQTKSNVQVEVKNQKLCPRYLVRIVRGVRIEPSPKWLQDKLLAFGIRPISNIVDISNLVMVETGQPLHFFDLDRLPKTQNKAKIIVRTADKDETITTLDGVTKKLDTSTLVIADKTKAIAVAGVMGGKESEVSNETKNILIEAAIFDKSNIRKTSRKLGLRSEAVARFEKGIPYMFPEVAINRAAQLLADLAGGKILADWVEASAPEEKKKPLKLNIEEMQKFLGVKISAKDSLDILERLGFAVEEKGENHLVTAPWWRTDITEKVDLYEEIIRIYGYDQIPSTLPATTSQVPLKNEEIIFADKTRKLLADIGLTEIVTYPFVTEKDLVLTATGVGQAPKVANPLVKEQEYLRSNLFSSMLTSLSFNQFLDNHIALFEISKTFQFVGSGKLPKETEHLICGFVGGQSWPIKYKSEETFYKAKGVIARLFGENKLNDICRFTSTNDSRFTKGAVAKITAKGQEIGLIGEVRKNLLENYDLKKKAIIVELDLKLLAELANREILYKPISKYPKTTRDISVIVKSGLEAAKVLEALDKVDPLIQETEIVDIYTGKPLDKSQKSISVRLHLLSQTKTLTDEEVEKVVTECHNKLKKLGGKIRGGSE